VRKPNVLEDTWAKEQIRASKAEEYS